MHAVDIAHIRLSEIVQFFPDLSMAPYTLNPTRVKKGKGMEPLIFNHFKLVI